MCNVIEQQSILGHSSAPEILLIKDQHTGQFKS